MTNTPQFFNRELSWIEFNARVLHEARREDIPLLERLKFLSIVSSNFDEFFMVRVAGLQKLIREGSTSRDLSGLTPQEQLLMISQRVHSLAQLQCKTLMERILPGLALEGMQYVASRDYSQHQLQHTQTIFSREIFPLLTPLRTDGHEFPHPANLRLYGAFALEPLPGIDISYNPFSPVEGEIPVALIQIPSSIPRIIILPEADSQPQGKEVQFTLLEDVICQHASQLFPGYQVEELLLFKVTRDADFAVDEDDAVDLTQAMEEVLKKRLFSLPVRLLCTETSRYLQSFLQEKLQLTDQDVYSMDGLIDPSALLAIAHWPQAASLTYEEWENFYPPILDRNQAMWDTLRHRDVLLHVPFESYEPVISFLNEAADDPNTLSIKMTLYRTSGESPVIKALERAAANGKQVTVAVELKARFDEKRNISWADQLEKAGVIVVRGIAHMKVHGKLLLVIRREDTKICRYLHISTGNYNDRTARLYEDLSLFTSDKRLTNDATIFFNIISSYSIIQSMDQLIMAPTTMRTRLLQLIERETELSSKEVPSLIAAKMNSLGDEQLIQALYKASRAGVKVLLNVRGICMLVPGIPGQSETIQVTSVIDRYLEHSRIFYFQNAGNEELYLSSADWMPRNMDKRIELMIPITQEETFKEVKKLLFMYFKDTSHAHILKPSGEWVPALPESTDTPFRVQEQMHLMYKHRVDTCSKAIPIEFIVRRKN